MKRKRIVATVCAVALGLAVSAAADEKVDKAAKELDQQFAKIKSYTSKSKTVTDYEFGPGHTQKAEMVGTMEWLRKGDKALMHAVIKSNTVTTEGGQTTKTSTTITTVSDGEFLYMLNDDGGQKTVIKNRAMLASDSRPSALFAQIGGYYVITLQPDETVDGADCYVFEMKMKPMEGVPPSGRQLVAYGKDNGLSVRSEAFDANGKRILSSTTTDIKLNADINPDRFKFEIPEGAQVSDMTGAQQQPAAQAETKAEAPEQEQPKKEEPEKKKKKGLKLPKLPKLP